MPAKMERRIDDLYADDPERADAVAFGRKTDVSRRGFLGGSGLAAMGAAVGAPIVFSAAMPAGLIPAALAQEAKKDAPAAPKGPQTLQFPGKDPGLVVLGDKPLVAETPEHLLDDDTTPTAKFFIRNNGQLPEAAKEPDAWKLTIDGEVNKPLEITLGDLKKRFKPKTLRMVLECGGNGRSFFQPQARGNQWSNGGAGCAEWPGVSLGDVLKAAGVKPSAVYTANYGTDAHLSGDAKRETLSRGVPIAKAMQEQGLLVWAMNGKPLETSTAARCGSSSRAGRARRRTSGCRRSRCATRCTTARACWARPTGWPSSRWCRAARRTILISRSWSPCRCAASSPARRTAPSWRRARRRSSSGVRPGPAISTCVACTSRPTSAQPGSRRRWLRPGIASTGGAGPRP